MLKKMIIPAMATAMCFAGCYYDNKEELYPTFGPCDTTSITYNNYVKGVMETSCALPNCHTGSPPQAGIQLDTYSGVRATALNMDKGAPGKLIGVITHTSGFSQMPSGKPKLDDCTIARITAWVNAGMPQ